LDLLHDHASLWLTTARHRSTSSALQVKESIMSIIELTRRAGYYQASTSLGGGVHLNRRSDWTANDSYAWP
jgi:hypothetical protein